MVSTSSITVQSLGKIVLRAPGDGAKMWCLYVCFFQFGRDQITLAVGRCENMVFFVCHAWSACAWGHSLN